MNEEWRDIKGYEGLYQVSNLGRVRSLRFKKVRILKPWGSHGYKHIELCVNNSRFVTGVHRLVAEAFIPNPLNLPEVNHKDRNRSNNVLDNLEWVNRSQDVAHAYANGVLPRPTHQNQPNQRKIKDVIEDKEYFSLREASRQTGHKRETIKRSIELNVPVCNNTHHFIYIN